MEKINISVSSETQELLCREATSFEIYKGKSDKPSINRVLNRIFENYYSDYNMARIKQWNEVRGELISAGLSKVKAEETAWRIVHQTQNLGPHETGKMKSNQISYKPLVGIEGLISEIQLQAGRENLSQSEYMRRIILSYLLLPRVQRERILFKKDFEVIDNAIKNGFAVSFSTHTNTRAVRHVIKPYEVLPGPDELYNYLIGVGFDYKTGETRVQTFRLCRISEVRVYKEDISISWDQSRWLRRMEIYGPQYEINSDCNAIVRMTEEGLAKYKRIYFGRPSFDSGLVKRYEVDGFVYYDVPFECSENQLLLYFRRFGAGAVIISPPYLRKKVIEFLNEAIQGYS